MNLLLARAVFAFLVMPGLVAFVVPVAVIRPAGVPFGTLGLIPLVLGGAMLLWCVRDFYVVGKGTLAPWDPPAHLVTTGLYRFSRNPMYVAVAMILWGWALGFHSRALSIYALFVMAAFYVRVVVFEEPFLARMHGLEWLQYQARVPRWIGSRHGDPSQQQHGIR